MAAGFSGSDVVHNMNSANPNQGSQASQSTHDANTTRTDTNNTPGRKDSFCFDKEMDEMTCSVCLEPYEEPKLLFCGHSICKKCSDNLMDGHEYTYLRRNTIQCPVCRKTTEVPCSGLPTNYGLQDMLAKFSSLHTQRGGEGRATWRTCISCQDRQREDAFWHCVQCESDASPTWICSTCALRYHGGHSLLELKQMKEKKKVVQNNVSSMTSEDTKRIESIWEGQAEIDEVIQNIAEVLQRHCQLSYEKLHEDLESAPLFTSAALDSLQHRTRGISERIQEMCNEVKTAEEQIKVNLQVCLNGLLTRFETSEVDISGSMETPMEPVQPDDAFSPAKRSASTTSFCPPTGSSPRSSGAAGIDPDASRLSPSGRPILVPRRRLKTNSPRAKTLFVRK